MSLVPHSRPFVAAQSTFCHVGQDQPTSAFQVALLSRAAWQEKVNKNTQDSYGLGDPPRVAIEAFRTEFTKVSSGVFLAKADPCSSVAEAFGFISMPIAFARGASYERKWQLHTSEAKWRLPPR